MAQALRDSAQALTHTPSGASSPMEAVDVTAEGAAGHGDVRVTVRNARLTRCAITESALTLDADAIGELVCDAVNAAMEDYQARLWASLQSQPGTDMAEVQRQLDAASREAERGMREYLDQLRALVDKTQNRPTHSISNPTS